MAVNGIKRIEKIHCYLATEKDGVIEEFQSRIIRPYTDAVMDGMEIIREKAGY